MIRRDPAATHTYAELEVSPDAYDEIAGKLREAKYDHAFMEDGTIDMHGIGLTRGKERERRQQPDDPMVAAAKRRFAAKGGK